MNQLLLLDQSITTFLKNFIFHNLFFNYFFSFFSLIGWAAIVWIVLAILLVIFEEIKHKKFILYFTISLLMTTLLVNIITKNIVRRPRPVSTNFNQFQLFPTRSCPIDFSFPSGHAATAFAAATILAYFDKKRRWFYYIVAILISYSRIFLGCHYFLDVIFGALIGYIVSRLLLFVLDTFPFRKKN
jgi:undecaprenyl-diphosphatase